jgi:hypothetical protein
MHTDKNFDPGDITAPLVPERTAAEARAQHKIWVASEDIVAGGNPHALETVLRAGRVRCRLRYIGRWWQYEEIKDRQTIELDSKGKGKVDDPLWELCVHLDDWNAVAKPAAAAPAPPDPAEAPEPPPQPAEPATPEPVAEPDPSPNDVSPTDASGAQGDDNAERGLNTLADNDAQGPLPEADDETISAVIKADCAERKQVGKKLRNLNELITPIKRRLKEKGFYAARAKISEIAHRPEFSELREPSGQTWKSKQKR